MDPEPASLIALFSSVDSLPVKLAVLLVLLCCSALISGAEVAFFSLSNTELTEAEESDSKKRNIVAELLQKPKRLLATILVGNNFINIAIVLISASITSELIADWNPLTKFITEVIAVTFLILLFGEILPKVYASRNSSYFSAFMARPLQFLNRLFWFPASQLSGFSSFIEERLGKTNSNISVDQLSQALELASEEDTTKEEQKILQGIVSFGNTDTKQVMRPRIDMFALDQDSAFSEVIPEVIKNGYSRIPVYEESIDTIVGVLYAKDLLPHIDKATFNWKTLVRDPYFVPENKKLDDLLKEFQEKKIHLAIVVDEYGGTSGIVTLEDIIEEIVGDISDEFDDEDLIFSKLDDHNYVFEGKTTLKDFYRVLKLEDDEALFEAHKGESETIAGFVLETSGSFPRKGVKINFHNYTFTVEALDKKRLKQIKVTIH